MPHSLSAIDNASIGSPGPQIDIHMNGVLERMSHNDVPQLPLRLETMAKKNGQSTAAEKGKGKMEENRSINEKKR